MPRTFSRNKRFGAKDIVRILYHLTTEELNLFVAFARLHWCPEKGLIEQDILPDIGTIRDLLTTMQPRESVWNIKHMDSIRTILSDWEKGIASMKSYPDNLPLV